MYLLHLRRIETQAQWLLEDFQSPQNRDASTVAARIFSRFLVRAPQQSGFNPRSAVAKLSMASRRDSPDYQSSLVKTSQGNHCVAQQSLHRSCAFHHGLTNKVLCQHQARDCSRLTYLWHIFTLAKTPFQGFAGHITYRYICVHLWDIQPL